MAESAIVYACLEHLALRGIFSWRNNTGAVEVEGRYIRYGLPGSPDILGILPDGKFLGVECKTPEGRQRRLQKRFQGATEENRGIYILARSSADLASALEDLGYGVATAAPASGGGR